MSTVKFDEWDRSVAISEVEKYFNVQLISINNRKKALIDQTGKFYWVIGGYENWHGIPSSMMDIETENTINGTLVIAKKIKNKISIYYGPLELLINNKKRLHRTKNGDYHFNISVLGDHMFIKEIPKMSLSKLISKNCTDEQKEILKLKSEITKLIKELNEDDKKALMHKLEKTLS